MAFLTQPDYVKYVCPCGYLQAINNLYFCRICRSAPQRSDGAAQDDVQQGKLMLNLVNWDLQPKVPLGLREASGAAVSDEQMRALPSPYPVDRYLVRSIEKGEVDNILDETLWQVEPTLRPEDEVMLRKLHEMLQSTTDELRSLSSDLHKIKEPKIQIKIPRAPLDKEFNEKLHIEELVTSKFCNTKIIDKNSSYKLNAPVLSKPKTVKPNVIKEIPVEKKSVAKKKNCVTKLGFSKTKVVHIEAQTKGNNDPEPAKGPESSVVYNEYSFKYEPKPTSIAEKPLTVQYMPQINIRSELKKQEVFNFEIIPGPSYLNIKNINNTVTVAVHRGKESPKQTSSLASAKDSEYQDQQKTVLINKLGNRKLHKMSACESSESSNMCNEGQQRFRLRTHSHKQSSDNKVKQVHASDRLRKRNVVKTKKSRNVKSEMGEMECKKNNLNNADYIPYSHLTLGGITLSDIEREELPQNDMPLSPILDKILSSRKENNRKLISTSDENLMQEVMDLKSKVTKTISDNINKRSNPDATENSSTKEDTNNQPDQEYDDDFEEGVTENSINSNTKSNDTSASIPDNKKSQHESSKTPKKDQTIQVIIPKKPPNLAIKDTVETFEFIHSVNTQDNATQSNSMCAKKLQETQTSPNRPSKPSIQPIHNDLWPLSTDPMNDVSKAFQLEKEFIKKLILEEYGDLIHKGTAITSSSKELDKEMCRNTAASQKNTQTSPARVKSIMTSPTRLKTRTTSPFILSDRKKSSVVLSKDKEPQIDIDLNDSDDLAQSINLSSPKYSLKLPKTSREVIRNLNYRSVRNSQSRTNSPDRKNVPVPDHRVNSPKYTKKRTITKFQQSSTSTIEISSSEISSLGEVRLNFIRGKKVRSLSTSSSSSTSSTSLTSIEYPIHRLPLRSEGEVTVAGNRRKVINEDATGSLGQLL